MSDLEVFGFLIVVSALCLARWRLGVVVCFFVGFLQDPIRKLIPGEPIYFTALVGLPLVATFVGAHLRNVRMSFRPVHAWNQVLRKPLNLFILLVTLQSVIAIVRTGNLAIGAIGTISYLAPLPAILIGYQFSRRQTDITKLLRVYLMIAVVMISGVYLSYLGYDWRILQSVGEGLFIYSWEKGKLSLYSGFLRSPEIAAWHAATSICLLILLAFSIRRKAVVKATAGVVIAFLAGALLMSGRRKFLVEIFLFLSTYSMLMLWFLKSSIKSPLIFKSALLLGSGLALASISYLYVATESTSTHIQPYLERGVSLQRDVSDRVSLMTVESFQWVIARNGILGSGAGTGSQGAQHFGGGANLVGSAAEGGLGKVLAELGVPGLLLLLWLVVSVGRYMWSIAQFVTHNSDVDPVLAKLVFGLEAFLITNGFVYVIAHQVFGDPFVLIILGFLLGFVLAMPKMLSRLAADRRQAAEDRRRTMTDGRSGIEIAPAIDDRRRSARERRQGVKDRRQPVYGRGTGVRSPSPAIGRLTPIEKQ